MSELNNLDLWNNAQLQAFKESGASNVYEVFIAKPELFPQEVQDAYFGTIERFTKALIRPNSYKTLKRLRESQPALDVYLKTLSRTSRQELIATIRKNAEVMNFLKAIEKKEITLVEFQNLVQALLTTEVGADMLVAMTDFSMPFCTLLREVYPEFKTKNTDKVSMKGFPFSSETKGVDPIIDAEWLIDQVFHTLAYQVTISVNYAHISDQKRPDLSTLN